ncbi:MAG: hypothetical protein HY401_05095 [Elusimicrobia bacterium]|nr:hypothetical protein [Elusimicrobiota bacterium]
MTVLILSLLIAHSGQNSTAAQSFDDKTLIYGGLAGTAGGTGTAVAGALNLFGQTQKKVQNFYGGFMREVPLTPVQVGPDAHYTLNPAKLAKAFDALKASRNEIGNPLFHIVVDDPYTDTGRGRLVTSKVGRVTFNNYGFTGLPQPLEIKNFYTTPTKQLVRMVTDRMGGTAIRFPGQQTSSIVRHLIIDAPSRIGLSTIRVPRSANWHLRMAGVTLIGLSLFGLGVGTLSTVGKKFLDGQIADRR